VWRRKPSSEQIDDTSENEGGEDKEDEEVDAEYLLNAKLNEATT
jgi:hypothetical protein